MKTGIVRDRRFILHNPGYGHPERPERLVSIYGTLDKAGIFTATTPVPAREATEEELCAVHNRELVKLVLSTRGDPHMFDGDTTSSPESVEAALLAAGGLCNLVKEIVEGRLTNGFALVRPPGHHAEPGRCMGFCIFNNVAVAARYATQKLGVERVLVIDWDIHHGNGTQWIFYNDPKVVYFSTHLYPYYPGTGGFEESGDGEGRGHNVNVPLPSRMGDQDYEAIFNRVLIPVADQFRPQLILVSAGYDIAKGDPLGSMQVTPEGFSRLTRIIMDIAEWHCEGRAAFTLEGGYDVRALSASVLATVKTLMGELNPKPSEDAKVHPAVPTIIEEVKQIQDAYWKGIK
jgi:acetoin utilization deacetylase AcuC-like enzyme